MDQRFGREHFSKTWSTTAKRQYNKMMFWPFPVKSNYIFKNEYDYTNQNKNVNGNFNFSDVKLVKYLIHWLICIDYTIRLINGIFTVLFILWDNCIDQKVLNKLQNNYFCSRRCNKWICYDSGLSFNYMDGSVIRNTILTIHTYICTFISYFITENFDLTISSVKRHRFTVVFIECINLEMQWEAFDTFLITKIRTQALNSNVYLRKLRSPWLVF